MPSEENRAKSGASVARKPTSFTYVDTCVRWFVHVGDTPGTTRDIHVANVTLVQRRSQSLR